VVCEVTRDESGSEPTPIPPCMRDMVRISNDSNDSSGSG